MLERRRGTRMNADGADLRGSENRISFRNSQGKPPSFGSYSILFLSAQIRSIRVHPRPLLSERSNTHRRGVLTGGAVAQAGQTRRPWRVNSHDIVGLWHTGHGAGSSASTTSPSWTSRWSTPPSPSRQFPSIQSLVQNEPHLTQRCKGAEAQRKD